jgi:uncharacterized DUF497 family protein
MYNVITVNPQPHTNGTSTTKGISLRTTIGPREVEEILEGDPIRISSRIDDVSGEERVLELGHTSAGRVLFVVWTPRGELTRPVTAFEANRRVRAKYRRERP